MKGCRIAASVLVFLFSAFCFSAESVMPPDVYARMSEQSKIKATPDFAGFEQGSLANTG